ncbi:DUF5615 family PIN-like protein [Candidatus Curtissbacteria bacterium]|nr:DUF5615 family PIN-like protein [Candidatus Curtissbacteria bacterium]
MTKFLLDANLSPKTSQYLREKFNFDIIDLITENKYDLTDEKVIRFAKRQKRVIITFDLDFGEIYYFSERGKVGIIVLRIENQTVESVNKVLNKFFQTETKNIDLEKSLVVIDEKKIRIIPNTN